MQARPLREYVRVEEGDAAGDAPSAQDWTRWAWRALAAVAIATLLVAIGALVASAIGAADDGKILHKLNKLLAPNPCAGEVSVALDAVTLNIARKSEGGSSIPPDTIMAVGNNDNGGRIIAVVNRAVVILNKATHTRISLTPNFYANSRPGGDPWVTWDATSNRFFLTAFNVNRCRFGLQVFSPPAVAGQSCVGDALFGPQTFNVNGETQVGSPLDGCTAMAPLTGKIAIVIRGTCGFVVKVKNAQNAGAIGVIIYNNAGDTALNMGGADPTIVIPSVFIWQSVGTQLVANSPANVTLSSGGLTTFATDMFISVSNTSSPDTRADFAHYLVTDGVYASQFVDYPKHSTDATALYIAAQNFGNETDGISPCIGPNIRAFDKAALMNGAGATTLWSTIIPGDGITAPRFVFPAETRTPITDQTLPAIFVGLNTGNAIGFCDIVTFQPTPLTALHIYAGTSAGLLPYVGVVPLPTPMTFGTCFPSTANSSCEITPLIRQPPPAVPNKIESLMEFIMSGVVRNGRLYTAFAHNISAVQTVIRWFEIDVAPVALGLQPTLLQWGDLNVDPDIDTFMPHIDVTEDNTMAIAFYTSGPNHYITASYTIRLDSDPVNTVRTPFHVAVPNEYVYFQASANRNRYGDYIGLQVDPVDGQKLYGYTQRPDPIGVFDPPGQFGPCFNASICVARDWTTDLFIFRVENNTCATDGIDTTPTVLPSTSPQVDVVPADFATFDAFITTDDIESDEDDGCVEIDDVEVCFS